MKTGVRYEILEGLYENTFSKILNKKIKFNIVFIDGNHKKEETLMYFEHLKSIMSIPSIMILDDIFMLMSGQNAIGSIGLEVW